MRTKFLARIASTLTILGSLGLADRVPAATYTFTQFGYSGTLVSAGELGGTFSGNVESDGTIQLADLTSFSLAFLINFAGDATHPPGIYGSFDNHMPLQFSFNTLGGGSSLAFFTFAPFPTVPENDAVCVGAYAALTLDCGFTPNAAGNFGGYTTTEFPTVELVTPLPGALPLLASGLAALGLVGWRRKRKAQASLAA